jgi:UDP-N-acetylmuramate dehydrogenase
VGSGVNWHEFVLYCIANNYAGVENLSLIPGTVGAAPIQNIGAYGVEVKNVIDQVFYLDFETNQLQNLQNAACKFGYRDSVFKNELKGKIFITAVSFILQKQPTFNTTYGAIATQLQLMGNAAVTLQAVSDAVIAIRQSKLPNHVVIGNAGSFFKNPTIPTIQFEALQATYPQIVGYANNENTTVKLAAGWLIEQCGLKGVQVGNTGCHKMQALVLVNYGGATGHEILEYSTVVINEVNNKFGITLEREINE